MIATMGGDIASRMASTELWASTYEGRPGLLTVVAAPRQ